MKNLICVCSVELLTQTSKQASKSELRIPLVPLVSLAVFKAKMASMDIHYTIERGNTPVESGVIPAEGVPDYPSVSVCSITDLSVELMERDPKRYFDLLYYFSGPDSHVTADALKRQLNETPYHSWHSNHAFCAVLLVGEMNSETLEEFGESNDGYFGGHLPRGIDGDFGIQLLDKIIECGGDITAKNYYDDTVVEYLDGHYRFKRIGDEAFNEHVRKVFANALS
jgi:hypothetical protein